ncbi:MAG: galactokinase family protein [Planctomycetota bacterium]
MLQLPDATLRKTLGEFQKHFDKPALACGIAPGRVEILGNHTDYNGGAVLTAAIDRYVVAAGRPLDEPRVRVRSVHHRETTSFSLDRLTPEPDAGWLAYVKSVFAVLRQAGVKIGGMELAIASNLPLGAGLSSSAALEAAIAMLVLELARRPIDRLELAKGLQRGEHEFAGVHCGLLDQFSVLFGRAGRVLRLDCATCDHEVLALGPDAPALVVCDSRMSRALGRDAPYNLRRSECKQAAERLRSLLNRPISHLCEVTLAELRDLETNLREPLFSRAVHVVSEHERVLAASAHLRAGDSHGLAKLLNASHESSRRWFENSTPALDRLCEIASGQPGFLGARLSGAGWGGAVLALVEPELTDEFVAGMTRDARPTAEFPAPEIIVCHAADGAAGRLL